MKSGEASSEVNTMDAYESFYYKDQILAKVTPDGISVSSYISEAISDFFFYSEQIETGKDINTRLRYCHEQLKLLPFFVKQEIEDPHGDGTLPPLISCRDWGPELYRRLGEWEKAREFIQECIKADAYHPDHGEQELAYNARYQTTALAALAYVRDNPGVLQKDIYKLVTGSDVDRDMLKNIMRCSRLFRKEPYKSTNKLYLSDIANNQY